MLKRQTIENGIWDVVPAFSFFIFFPLLGKALSQDQFNLLMGCLPIISFASTFDFGVGRSLLRFTDKASGRHQRAALVLLRASLGNVFVYLVPLLSGILWLMAALDFYQFTGLQIVILIATPILGASAILATYFDGLGQFRIQNRTVSPILALQWPVVLLASWLYKGYVWPLIIAILLPRILILYIQLANVPRVWPLSTSMPQKIWRSKNWRANCLISLMAPLCSNLDRFVMSFFGGAASGVYIALSEISRRSSGMSKPFLRVLSSGSRIFVDPSARASIQWLAVFGSIGVVIAALIFGCNFLWHSGLLTGSGWGSVGTPGAQMTIVFAVAAGFQAQSVIFFLVAVMSGKANSIAKYQFYQIVVSLPIFLVLAATSEYSLCAFAYALLRVGDFIFLRKLTGGKFLK